MKAPTSKADLLIAISNLYLAAVGYTGRSSGEIYAMVMPQGITLAQHEAMIRGLTSCGIIAEQAHFLTLTALGQELYGKVSASVQNNRAA